MKNIMKNLIMAMLCCLVIVASMPVCVSCNTTPAPGPATNEGNTNSNIGSAESLDEKLENIMSDGEQRLVNISMAALPLAMILILVLMLFTHDPKKIAGFIWLLIVIVGVCAGILLVHHGYVLSFIQELIGLN